MQFRQCVKFMTGTLLAVAFPLMSFYYVHGAEEVDKALAKDLAPESGQIIGMDSSAGQAAKSQDGDSQGAQQEVYPGIKNLHIERGGAGQPVISIYYPETGHSAVDEAVKKYVEEVADNYQKNVTDSYAEDEDKPDSFGNWEETGFFTVEKPNPDVISITFNLYTFTGGAHGMVVINVQNYDLKTGRLLELSDLFEKPEVALEIMSRISEEKLRQSLGDEVVEDMLKSGTAPEEDNFQALSLLPGGLVVEFQPYQVGPWSIGQQRVEINLDDLKSAGPASLVWPHKGSAPK